MRKSLGSIYRHQRFPKVVRILGRWLILIFYKVKDSCRRGWVLSRIRMFDWERKKWPKSYKLTREEGKIVYFCPACGADFGLLQVSLTSFVRSGGEDEIRFFYVCEDGVNGFRSEERTSLQSIFSKPSKLRFYRLPSSYPKSYKRFQLNLRIIHEILLTGEISENDYISKVDSDIFWIRADDLAGAVLASGAHYYGHECAHFKSRTGYVFAQGGIYLIKAAIVMGNLRHPSYPSAVMEAPRLLPTYTVEWGTEDALTFLYFRPYVQGVVLTKLYPDQLDPVTLNRVWEERSYVAIHFEGREYKLLMLSFAMHKLS